MKIKLKRFNEKAVVPRYAKEGDAAMDLVAVSREVDKYGNISYGTGVGLEIPLGYVGLVFPRSSISKTDLTLSNSVGVIDSGYRGEIFVKFKPALAVGGELATIQGEEDYEIGDRVCQIMIIPIPSIEFEEVEELSDSIRGAGGFGSSGK